MRNSCIAALIVGSLAVGCGGDDDGHDHDHDLNAATSIDASVDAALNQAVELAFAAQVGGAAFSCGQSYSGIGSTAATYVANDFRFYVHDVRLTGSGGEVAVALDVNDWQSAGGVALLDFESGGSGCQTGTAGTHTALSGTVPSGSYTGIKFKVGVPFELNHLEVDNTTPSPLNIPALYWAWTSGYKFMKIDGTSGENSFPFHLGSTGCSGPAGSPQPCTSPNVFEVTLDDYSPGDSVIVADLAVLLGDSDITTNLASAPGCMSGPDDPECVAIFPQLGLAIGEQPAGAQQFFAVQE